MERPMSARCAEVRDLAAGFVLGALEPDEDRLVREHLASCREAHPEFAELGGVIPYLNETVELVEPPAALRGRILSAAAADLAGRGAPGRTSRGTADLGPSARPSDGRAPREASMVTAFPTASERDARRERRRSPLRWVPAIAAVLAIAALAGWNVLLQSELRGVRDRQQGIAAELDVARQYQQGVEAVLDLAGTPGSQTAFLTAEGGTGPTGMVAVSPEGEVAIVMRDLAPTKGTEVYEAWVIPNGGTAIAIGGFTPGPNGTATFRVEGTSATPGVTVALTHEPAPNQTVAQGPIVSSGVVGGRG
jgi:hypothetical protein